MAYEKEFGEIFSGNPTAHYTWRPGEYVTAERGINEEDIARHLRGELPGLLSIPIMPDGLVHFVAGDCDRHGEKDEAINHEAIACKIKELGLPLVITRSKSVKSAHVWLVFKNEAGFDAAIARQLMSHYVKLLGIEGKIEIFPKQEKLKGGQVGSAINLPYFGEDRVGFGPEGEILDLGAFIQLVEKRRAFGEKLAERDLADRPEAKESKEQSYGPMSVERIRAIHAENLTAMCQATKPGRNELLNKVAYFAGRAFKAGALDGSEKEIRDAVRNAARASGLEEREIESTEGSGWNSGLDEPFTIRETITDPRDIGTGLEAFQFFQENFFVCEDFGGHVRIMWLEGDANPAFKGRRVLGHQSREEFEKRYDHLTVTETYIDENDKEHTKQVKILDYWLRSEHRRQYKNVVFAPGRDLGSQYMNLWGGFSVKSVAGSCELFKAHLHHVICASNPTLSSWAVKQLAYWAQHPGEPGYVAFVLIGGKGLGKNSFVEYFGEMWGEHFLTISNGEHLGGRFNKHFINCSLLHANESFYAGNRSHESAMKVLITDSSLTIEPKGVDLFQIPNMLHLIISSNRDWVVPSSVDERRFAVFNLSDKHAKDFAYFEALHKEKENGGKEALLHFLLEMDLTGFNPRNPPMTVGLCEQIGHSLEGAESFWHEVLMMGVLPNMKDDGTGPMYDSWRVKTYDLINWAKVNNMAGSKQLNAQNLGRLLTANRNGKKPSMGFKIVRPVDAMGNQERFLSIPTLAVCRKLWDELRFEETWEDPQAEWESVPFSQRRAA